MFFDELGIRKVLNFIFRIKVDVFVNSNCLFYEGDFMQRGGLLDSLFLNLGLKVLSCFVWWLFDLVFEDEVFEF